jgi:hypothetical protein
MGREPSPIFGLMASQVPPTQVVFFYEHMAGLPPQIMHKKAIVQKCGWVLENLERNALPSLNFKNPTKQQVPCCAFSGGRTMSLLTRLQQMNSDASALESSSEEIYGKIKNVQPFEGPGLEKNLRQLEADVKRLLTKADGLAQLNAGAVRLDDVSEINDLWGNLRSSLNSCNASLSAGREYLENESILVFLSTVVKEIGKLIRDTIQLTDKTIKGLLKGSK